MGERVSWFLMRNRHTDTDTQTQTHTDTDTDTHMSNKTTYLNGSLDDLGLDANRLPNTNVLHVSHVTSVAIDAPVNVATSRVLCLPHN